MDVNERVVAPMTKKGPRMKIFTIDVENNITAFVSPKDIQGSESGTETFTNSTELAGLAARWPGARLVEIWNGLTGVRPIQRFTSRTVAAKRIWEAIQSLEPGDAVRPRTMASKKGRG